MGRRDKTARITTCVGVTCLLGSAGLLGCNPGGPTVTLSAEDSRFDPTLVRVQAGAPFTLNLYNAGREVHEFASPLLGYAKDLPLDSRAAPPSVVMLEPGRAVRFLVEAPPGTYLYWCKRKGHPNMTGTLIIEEAPTTANPPRSDHSAARSPPHARPVGRSPKPIGS